MADDQPIIKLENLGLQYGGNTVLHHIQFHIQHNETLGLVGESGSGKSQTALTIMRLLPANARLSSGKILWEDRNDNLLERSEKQMQSFRGKQVSLIFQDPQNSLNPLLTCGFQVAETILIHEKVSKTEAKKRTLDLFEQVQLPDPVRIYKSYPHQISGGQKQRVMIAMAVSCRPKLLIADEPTTALDVTVQASVLELLNKLKKTYGMSMLFISHDLAVVGQMADRVAVMYRGEIVECETTEQIFKHPKHPYTKALIACRPQPGNRLSRLPMIEFVGKAAQEWQTTAAVPLSEQQLLAHRNLLYTQQAPILTFNNLTAKYSIQKNLWGTTKKWLNALENVSFEVYAGETIGIVGESGSGKTTLGRTLMRLVETASGSIYYKGQRIDKMEGETLRKFRKTIQIIFQDSYAALDPLMTAGASVAEPLIIHKLFPDKKSRWQRVKSLFEMVGLDPQLMDRLPNALSGGQRQRVCIARALALEPEIIICDESVSALDMSLQAQVLNLLADLREKKQLTYIFISHDLNVVNHFCDRVIVLQNGRLVESGYPDDILKHPQQAYTQRLVEAIPLMPT